MSEQTVVPAPSPDELTPDPTLGWNRARAEAAGLELMSQRPPMGQYLRQLWARREFIIQLPLGSWHQQHMNTVLGTFWHLLSPLLLCGVYYLIFGILLQIDREIDNYPIYLIAGIITYRFTQKSIQQGAKAVVKNEKMLHNIRFPAAVLPLSSTITETLAQGPALLVLVGFAVVTGESPHWLWLLVLPLTLVQAVFNFGLAAITARLTVHFRDTEEILTYILRIGFYLSGVIVGPERIPAGAEYDWARTLFHLNPAYAFIAVVRGLVRDATIDTGALTVASAWTLGILVVGFVYFWRFEGRYANAV